jgi:hypothetical protein
MGFAASSETNFCDRTTTWVLLSAAKQAFMTGLQMGFAASSKPSFLPGY